MKKLFFLILIFFISNCSILLAQNNIKNAEIEYTANTRGFYQKIYIKNQMISISRDRNDSIMPASTKIALKDWKFLTAEFKNLKLVGLSKLKPPTAKRLYDGAAIADLKIILNGKTYQTESFDNGYPNIKIKKFVDKVTSLAKKE
jgi:hypothetical protein